MLCIRVRDAPPTPQCCLLPFPVWLTPRCSSPRRIAINFVRSTSWRNDSSPALKTRRAFFLAYWENVEKRNDGTAVHWDDGVCRYTRFWLTSVLDRSISSGYHIILLCICVLKNITLFVTDDFEVGSSSSSNSSLRWRVGGWMAASREKRSKALAIRARWRYRYTNTDRAQYLLPSVVCIYFAISLTW